MRAAWVTVVLLSLILVVLFTGLRFPAQHCVDTEMAPATFDFYGKDIPAKVKTDCTYDFMR